MLEDGRGGIECAGSACAESLLCRITQPLTCQPILCTESAVCSFLARCLQGRYALTPACKPRAIKQQCRAGTFDHAPQTDLWSLWAG